MTDNPDLELAVILRELAAANAAHFRSETWHDPAYKKIADRMLDRLDRVSVNTSELSQHTPKVVRGLRHAPTVLEQPLNLKLERITHAARAAFEQVNWSEFYVETAWSGPFVGDFASGEAIGPDGRIFSDELIVGLFLLGPDTLYPPHAHPALEAYVVVSGAAEFQVGDEKNAALRRPGDIILHREDEPHAIRTGDQPLFAVYIWIGNIQAGSWHSLDMTNPEADRVFPPLVTSMP